MKPTLLRVVLGALVALALLDGALARPHSSSAPSQSQQQPGLGNDLSVRHGHHPHHRHHGHAHHVRQLCGGELSNFLRHLCAGRGYNSPDNMAGAASTSRRRGLASECCHVGCTLSDLEQYCMPHQTPLVASQSTSESHETASEYESDPSPETGNHIRPAALEEPEPAREQEQKAPSQPTVVGGKVGSKLEVPSYNASNMIQVGVIKLPPQFRTPVTIGLPTRPQSNSLGSH